MTAIRRMGLRLLLPPLMTVLSISVFWYGTVQDRITRAALEKQGWHFGAAWHPNSLVEFVGALDLPAMLGGVLLINLFTEAVVNFIVFGAFVPLVWWLVGQSADVEFRLGSAQGRARPPLRERTITLTSGIFVIGLLGALVFGHTFRPRFVGFFWITLLPVSMFTWAARWGRKGVPQR